MSAQKSKEYHGLRAKLNNFGYREYFSHDSMQLVERLSADLIHITDLHYNNNLHTGHGFPGAEASPRYIKSLKSKISTLIIENND